MCRSLRATLPVLTGPLPFSLIFLASGGAPQGAPLGMAALLRRWELLHTQRHTIVHTHIPLADTILIQLATKPKFSLS